MDLPSGTVTFLLTDIEASTHRWELAPDAMPDDLARHDDLVRDAIEAHGGVPVKHTGDGFLAVFESAPAAVDAAEAAQLAVRTAEWGPPGPLRIRVGVHTGDAEPLGGDYFGPTVNRAARVADVANGDQIVCSRATAALCRERGFRDVGVHQLRGVGAERLFVAVVEGSDGHSQILRTTDWAESNLPVNLTGMVGRDRELAELAPQVRAHRILTLIGPGGVGKTRLAVGLAASMLDEFPGGVRYCELAPVGDPAAVASAVAAGVGARKQTGLSLVESIASFLEGRRTLIVIDNCEHVLDEVNRIVTGLAGVEGVRVMATSREPIGMVGEQLWSVRPLDPSTSGYELFVERAREHDPDFSAETHHDAIIEICHRLDGIPLAVELAAARVGHLTPAEIAGRLDDRFRLLRGGRRGERHRTLLDTVQWSYDLLEPHEALLFARLSVFAGDFTVDSAEAVVADEEIDALDVLDGLSVLVDKSMLVLEREGGGTRYAMLETLRQFGEEQLDSAHGGDELRRRHAGHYRDLVVHEDGRLNSPEEAAAWRTLAAEWDNIRAAIDHSERTGDHPTAIELILGVFWYASYAIRQEGHRWASDALVLPGIERHPDYGSLCGAAALAAYFAADPGVQELAERGLVADPADPRGFCHIALAAEFLNNLLARDESEAVIRRWHAAAGPKDLSNRLWASGMAAFHYSSLDPTPELAAEHAAETMRLARECGGQSALAVGYWATGLALMLTDPAAGVATLDAGVGTALGLSPRHLISHLIRGVLVHHRARATDLNVGLEECRGALVVALDDHYEVGTSHLLSAASQLLLRAGDDDRARGLVQTMIANGHVPRGRRLNELVAGSRLPARSMSVREAAADALDAIARIQADILVDA